MAIAELPQRAVARMTAQVVEAMQRSQYFQARFFEAALQGPESWRRMLEAVTQAKEASDWVALRKRWQSGLRYRSLVQTLGAELFGSAVLPGEVLLAEDGHFSLTYIPPKAGVAPSEHALFHVGGVLPYGDPLFRLMPGVCFFERFTERGMGVYAMALRGDKQQQNYRKMRMSTVMESLGHLAGVAFQHNQGRKMIAEGYCGLGPHLLTFAAVNPALADRLFSVLATFVAPVDGRRCHSLAEIMRYIPELVLKASYSLAEKLDLYISGDQLRLTQDIALGAMTAKTPMGSFASGWLSPAWADVSCVQDLTFKQQRELAGAYWISSENCRRFPVPVDLARFSERQFKIGVTEDGVMPFAIDGESVDLRRIFSESNLQVVSFYGGKDTLVPHETAHPMQAIGGDRYTHVVHPGIGHVGYILNPDIWRSDNARSLNPNPIDCLQALAEQAKPCAPEVVESHQSDDSSEVAGHKKSRRAARKAAQDQDGEA